MKRKRSEIIFPEIMTGIYSLGGYIRIARKRRRMTMRDVAARLNLGYQTIVRIERGDPNVSLSAYISVLWLFGLSGQFIDAVHPDSDKSGKSLELSRLPQRVREAVSKTKGGKYDF